MEATLADISSMSLPYPARTKQAAGEVGGVRTDVMVVEFSDRILVTVTQGGRLAQWIHVPLLNDNPTQSDTFPVASSYSFAEDENFSDDTLLPLARFTPRTLLGAGGPARETQGQLYASQIASAITAKTPDETRTLVLGLGLAKVEMERDGFMRVMELVLRCL